MSKRAWQPNEDAGLLAAGKARLAEYANSSDRSIAACQMRLDRLTRGAVATCPTCGQSVTEYTRQKTAIMHLTNPPARVS